MRLAIVVLGVASSFACSGENRQAPSDLKLGNAVNVEQEVDETRAVVMLRAPTSIGSMRGYCSGTLLNDTTLITAAHCLQNFSDGGIHLETPSGTSRSLRAFYADRTKDLLVKMRGLQGRIADMQRDAYREDSNCSFPSSEIIRISSQVQQLMRDLPQRDVAIVVFPPGTGDAITGGRGYYGVAENMPEVGTKTMFLGYGQSSTKRVRGDETCAMLLRGEGFGVKRKGINQLARVESNSVSIDGYASTAHAENEGVAPGEQVSVRPGDSGGPWIHCRREGCDSYRIFAVNSTGSFRGSAMEQSHGASVTSNEIRSMFQNAIQCDEEPCAQNFAGSGIE